MKIPENVIMINVNNNAVEVIRNMTNGNYKDIPIMFTGASTYNGKLPDIACILDESATDKLCDEMADKYCEDLESMYSMEGENIDESEPNYDGIYFMGKEEFTGEYQTGYSFYALNGEFYDSIVDVM